MVASKSRKGFDRGRDSRLVLAGEKRITIEPGSGQDFKGKVELAAVAMQRHQEQKTGDGLRNARMPSSLGRCGGRLRRKHETCQLDQRRRRLAARRRRIALFGLEDAGRWSLMRRGTPASAVPVNAVPRSL